MTVRSTRQKLYARLQISESGQVNAPLSLIFVSQCIDSLAGLAVAASFLFAGFGLFQSDIFQLLANASAPFWLGIFGTLFVANLLCRLIGIALLGTSLGNSIAGIYPLSVSHDVENPQAELKFWSGHVVEAFFVIMPGAWALELLGRTQNSRFVGHRYILSSP